MKSREQKGKATEVVYFPDQAVEFAKQEPGLYISRMGEAQNNDRDESTFLTPYSWGMIPLEGDAYTIVRRKKYHLTKNTMFIARANQEYKMNFDISKDFVYLWFDFRGVFAEDVLEQALGNSVYLPSVPMELVEKIRSFQSLLDKGENALISSNALAWNLVAAMEEKLSKQKGVEKNNYANSCAKIMETQFASGITVKSVASDLKVDRSTLYRQFVKVYGVSPKKFLNKLRVERAQSLLITTDMTVKSIAIKVGFDSLQHFYLAYKKEFQETPIQSRKAARN